MDFALAGSDLHVAVIDKSFALLLASAMRVAENAVDKRF
jgi:hypothetical protein